MKHVLAALRAPLRSAALAAAGLLAFAPALARAEAPAAAPATIHADPAMWVVRSKTATVYLLGSVHLLKPNTDWHSPKVKTAIGEAQDLWLEVTDADDQAKMMGLVQKYAMSTNGPLTKKLSAEDDARLDRIAHSINPNASAAVFDPLRPWFVALQLTVVEIQKSGYDPKSGVDLKLKAEFKAAGKPVNGIETAEQQVQLLADMTPEEELAELHDTLKDYDKSRAKLEHLMDAWAHGDMAAIEKLELTEMKADSPKLYQRLVADRNVVMAKAVKARLDGTGVSLISVGALHFAGPDGIPAQLAKLGIEARRVQ